MSGKKVVVMLCAMINTVGTNIVELHLKNGTYTVVYAMYVESLKVNQRNIDLGIVESTLLPKRNVNDLMRCIGVWNVDQNATTTGSITCAKQT